MSKINQVLFLSLLLIFFGAQLAQAASTDIVGIWTSSRGTLKIYKTGSQFAGKVIAINPAIATPEEKRRANTMLGKQLIGGLKYKDGAWVGGSFKNPQDGKDYACELSLKDANTLEMRVYIGIKMLGKSLIWKRQS